MRRPRTRHKVSVEQPDKMKISHLKRLIQAYGPPTITVDVLNNTAEIKWPCTLNALVVGTADPCWRWVVDYVFEQSNKRVILEVTRTRN